MKKNYQVNPNIKRVSLGSIQKKAIVIKKKTKKLLLMLIQKVIALTLIEKSLQKVETPSTIVEYNKHMGGLQTSCCHTQVL